MFYSNDPLKFYAARNIFPLIRGFPALTLVNCNVNYFGLIIQTQHFMIKL